MTDETRKRIALVFRILTILWFIVIAVLEVHYVIGVFRQRATFHHMWKTIYEEQIEGINVVLLVIFLIPGVFFWAVYRRFRRSY
jgi:hypothetical protein